MFIDGLMCSFVRKFAAYLTGMECFLLFHTDIVAAWIEWKQFAA